MPPRLTTTNSMPSRTIAAGARAPKVQYRLPIQFAMIASAVEITFAYTGPSCTTDGSNTVSRSRLNTPTSITSPTAPTSAERASWVISAPHASLGSIREARYAKMVQCGRSLTAANLTHPVTKQCLAWTGYEQ